MFVLSFFHLDSISVSPIDTQDMEHSLARVPDWKAKLTSELRVFIQQQTRSCSNGEISSLVIKTLFDSSDKKKTRLEKVESLRETLDIIMSTGDVPFGDIHYWVANFLVEELSARRVESKPNRSIPGVDPIQAIVVQGPGQMSTSNNPVRKPNEVVCSTCKSILLKKNLKRHLKLVHRMVTEVDVDAEEDLMENDDQVTMLGKRGKRAESKSCSPGSKYRVPYADEDSRDPDWMEDGDDEEEDTFEENDRMDKNRRPHIKKRGKLAEPRRRRLNLPSAKIPSEVETDLSRYYHRGIPSDGSSVEWKGLRMTLCRFMFWTNPDITGTQTLNDIDS